MPRKKPGFGLAPGLGIYRKERVPEPHVTYPADVDPGEIEDIFDEMFPAVRGLPKDPKLRRWKRDVMTAGWKLAVKYIKQGMHPRTAFRKGLENAYKLNPHPKKRRRRKR